MFPDSIALAFRRPSTINFTPVIRKCIAHLETSAHAATQDRCLAIWAELQHRAENVNAAMVLNGQTMSANGGVDFRMSDAVAGLQLWMESVDRQQINGMRIQYPSNCAECI